MSEEYNNGGPPLKHIIPFWEKATMTLDEASEYSGIGRNTLYRLTNQNNCPFVLWVGSKRRIKRKQLDELVLCQDLAQVKMRNLSSS